MAVALLFYGPRCLVCLIEWAMAEDHVSRIQPGEMVYLVKALLSLSLGFIGCALLHTRPDHVEHALGVWRMAKRVGTTALFFVGVALIIFRAELARLIAGPPEVALAILGCLCVALAALSLRGLGAPVAPDEEPLEKATFSSHYLHFPEELVDVEEDRQEALRMIYYSTRTASADLRDRNLRLKKSLDATEWCRAIAFGASGA